MVRIKIYPGAMNQFVLGYNVTLGLSDLRDAFESRIPTRQALYVKVDGFESASQTVQVPNSRGEYRLRVILQNRDDLTFRLTPGLQMISGTVLSLVTVKRSANGLKLTDEGGNEIKLPFKGSLDVAIEAASLPSDVYQVEVYQK